MKGYQYGDSLASTMAALWIDALMDEIATFLRECEER